MQTEEWETGSYNDVNISWYCCHKKKCLTNNLKVLKSVIVSHVTVQEVNHLQIRNSDTHTMKVRNRLLKTQIIQFLQLQEYRTQINKIQYEYIMNKNKHCVKLKF